MPKKFAPASWTAPDPWRFSTANQFAFAKTVNLELAAQIEF
jgi:hypothetical protein